MWTMLGSDYSWIKNYNQFVVIHKINVLQRNKSITTKVLAPLYSFKVSVSFLAWNWYHHKFIQKPVYNRKFGKGKILWNMRNIFQREKVRKGELISIKEEATVLEWFIKEKEKNSNEEYTT